MADSFNQMIAQRYLAIDIVYPKDINTPYYCELVISKSGVCLPLIGSHDTALLYLASIARQQTMDEIEANTPPKYYADYREYLMALSGAVVVWYNQQWLPHYITKAQRHTLTELSNLQKIENNETLVSQLVYDEDTDSVVGHNKY